MNELGTDKQFADQDHAVRYKKYRPKISNYVINKVLEFLLEKKTTPNDLAVDIGCGSGQATGQLAPHFTQVVGVDTSEAQIEQAKTDNNLHNLQFKVCNAERLDLAGIENSSVDLLFVATAYHWFDIPAFHRELARVLKPDGCVAIFCYFIPDVMDCERKVLSPEENPLQIAYETIGHHWHERMRIYEKLYDDIQLPVSCQTRLDLRPQRQWTITYVRSIISTWSGYQALLAKEPERARQLLEETTERCLKLSDNPNCDRLSLDQALIWIQGRDILIQGRK